MTWSRGAAVGMLMIAAVAIFCSLGLLTGTTPASGGGPDTTRDIGLTVGALGLTIAVLGLLALRSYRRARRVLVDGEPGYARVLRVRETGSEYSGVPQVELRLSVTTVARGTYLTTVKDLVPALRWAHLTMNGLVAVRVDRDDRDRVLLDGDRAVPEAAAPALPPGTRGKALLLQVTPSLTADDDGNPVFDVVLRLDVEGGPAVSVPARFGVPPERVAGMIVGAEVAMRVDSEGMLVPWWEVR